MFNDMDYSRSCFIDLRIVALALLVISFSCGDDKVIFGRELISFA
jgi:hypothetical protein